MLLGADLAHVICEPKAGDVIKTYSPDLIVHRILDEEVPVEKVEPIFNDLISRLHVLVIGPGMGRSDANQAFGRMALRCARQKGMYVVLDADGLWMVQKDPEVVKGYEKAVLTPNVMEFKRLCDKLNIDASGDPKGLCAKVSNALGRVTIVQKGPEDIISNGVDSWTVSEQGGLKRSGGQGDVLSGCMGTFLAWGKNYEEGEYTSDKPRDVDSPKISVLAAYGACTVVRTSSRFAFARKKRSMQASDLLDDVGNSYEYHFGEGGQSVWEQVLKKAGL